MALQKSGISNPIIRGLNTNTSFTLLHDNYKYKARVDAA